MAHQRDKVYTQLNAQDLGGEVITLEDGVTTTEKVLTPDYLPGSVPDTTEYVEDTETGQTEADMIGATGKEAEFYLLKKAAGIHLRGDAICKATIKIKSDGNAAHLHDVTFTLKKVDSGGSKTQLGTKTVAVDDSTTSATFVTKEVIGIIEGLDEHIDDDEDIELSIYTTGKIETAGTVTHRLCFTNGTAETSVKLPTSPGIVADPNFFFSANGMSRFVSALSGSGFGLRPNALGDSIALRDIAGTYAREMYVDAAGAVVFNFDTIAATNGLTVHGDADVLTTGSLFSLVLDEGGTDRNILQLFDSSSQAKIFIGGLGHAEQAEIWRTSAALYLDSGVGGTQVRIQNANSNALVIGTSIATYKTIIPNAGGILNLGSPTEYYLQSHVAEDRFTEKSADPTEPTEGTGVIWMSDGTGYGDDGDICVASQAGGATKKAILFDHSAGAGW